eukprot:TRINITY_DN1676_c0_g1_i3.p2 TRINITY_DN1676_c0_g1~~TRINITY_DN1676_c0_g1_i3.p2  ORF type:complete len:286 (-),score=77.28 TRINITY_DN1676_c0_g1_i3:578-1435(-)
MNPPQVYAFSRELAADGVTALYTTVVILRGVDWSVLRCRGAGVPTLDLPAVLAASERPLPSGAPRTPGKKGGPPLPVDPLQAFPKYRPSAHTKYTGAAGARYAPPTTPKIGALLHYVNPALRKQAKASIASEVAVMEALRSHRLDARANHIVGYHGVAVAKGRITWLVVDMVPCVLWDRCRESPRRPMDVDLVIGGVRAGLELLHELNFCHNDVCEKNVGLTADGQAVLINLDSCVPPGEPLTKWCATKRADEDATTSCVEMTSGACRRWRPTYDGSSRRPGRPP